MPNPDRILKSSVERYDPGQNSWSYVASMQQSRCYGQACVIAQRIFVFGGEAGGQNVVPKCEIYDPVTDEWQMCCFTMNATFTLKPRQELKDAGTFCGEMLGSDATADFSDVNCDPREVEARLPRDSKCYVKDYVYRPSVAHCNGMTVAFNFCSGFREKIKITILRFRPRNWQFYNLVFAAIMAQ